MKTWVRAMLNRAGVTFGVFPSPVVAGGAGSEGESVAVARADHVHPLAGGGAVDVAGVADFYRGSNVFFTECLEGNTTGNFGTCPYFVISHSAIGTTYGDIDDSGNTGGHGTLRLETDATTTDSVSNSYLLYSQTQFFPDQLDTEYFLVARMRVFETRIRIVRNSTQLASCTVLIGGLRLTTTPDGGTGDPIASALVPVLDGLYFRIDTDGSAVGNWFACATVAGSTTAVDTGVAPIVNTDLTVAFQTFRITFDGSTARYFIRDVDENGDVVDDGTTSLAELTTDLPVSPAKVDGYGYILKNRTDVLRATWVDSLLHIADREYTA